MDLRPNRGGFLRPFGCGWFIREFDNAPFGSPVIVRSVGVPQAVNLSLLQGNTSPDVSDE